MVISPPLRGVNRRSNLESPVPLTCFDALNVLGVDYKSGRIRIAVAPGWTAFGSQSGVNLISQLGVVSATGTSTTRSLITAAGGTLYKWSGTTPSSIGSGITTGRGVMAAPYLQQLFIANDSTPKVYDNDTSTTAAWTATMGLGSVPAGCPVICEWANRIVLAGNPAHIWYMSRIGDPYDWLFTDDPLDKSSPVSATDTEGGQIGEPITAMIPHNRDCLLISSANVINVARGNPTGGGRFERVSHVSGITNKEAWCRTANDWSYFMTRKGLARMPPGCGDYPELVSDDVIPESMKAIDGISKKAYLAYDVLLDSIHIYTSGSPGEYWLYDIKAGAFWPRTPPGASILAMMRYDTIETSDASGVLVATSGNLFHMDRTVAIGGTDNAYVSLGPYELTQGLGLKALVQKLLMKFGANTDDVDATVDVYCDTDGESATLYPLGWHYQCKIRDLLDGKAVRPRTSGQAEIIRIRQHDTSKHWSWEDGHEYNRITGVERSS